METMEEHRTSSLSEVSIVLDELTMPLQSMMAENYVCVGGSCVKLAWQMSAVWPHKSQMSSMWCTDCNLLVAGQG